MSQDKLAELTDVSVQQVSRWENDRSSPTIPRLEIISRATGRPVYWFFLGPTGIRMDYPPEYAEAFLQRARDYDQTIYAQWKSGESVHIKAPLNKVLERELDSLSEPNQAKLTAALDKRKKILEDRDAEWAAAESQADKARESAPPTWFTQAINKFESRLAELESELEAAKVQVKHKDPTPLFRGAQAPDKRAASTGADASKGKKAQARYEAGLEELEGDSP